MIRKLMLLLATGLAPLPAAAETKCHVDLIATLPVTMQGTKPITHASINGHDESFILDSGAGYSHLSGSIARELKIPLTDLPNFHVRGVGGSASASVAVVKSLGIAGASVSNISFIVGGSV